MSNDIPKDMNNYVNLPKGNNSKPNRQTETFDVKENDTKYVPSDIDMEKSMGCLLGKMQVKPISGFKSSDSIKKSSEEFMDNPADIQDKVDFCDELVQRGYSLEDAILKTDMFFDALKTNVYE